MGYVIVTDSRRVKGERLFMVDRRVQRQSFWSNRLDDVRVFANKAIAMEVIKTIRFNNPRVVSYEEARVVANSQKQVYDQPMFHQAHLEPWDDHKSWR